MPDQSIQARIARLESIGQGNGTAATNLRKQLAGGSTVNTPPPQVNTDPLLNTDQSNFEAGWQGYSDAAKGVYDIETGRTLQQYDQKKQALDLATARNREDYAKYTSNQQTQTNRQLASTSKDFARKLASASNAYGQRGILRSGIAKGQIGEATTDYANEQTYFKTQSQRELEAGQQQYGRQLDDLTTQGTQLGESKAQYTGDRAVGKDILANDLTRAGDTAYNNMQTNKWATEQQMLAQDAKNKVLGITKPASKRTWRSGGVYSAQ